MGSSKLTIALCAVLLLAGCAREEGGPVTLKLSLILGTGSDWYRGAVRWKELVEGRTGGRIKVRVVPEASLSNHNQRTELESVQSGALDASLESTILLSTLEPKFDVFSLPWLFKDHVQANRICDGPLGKRMLDLLPPKRLVGLAFGVNGFRQITNNQRPIRRLEDLRHLKIRVPSIKMYISIFRLFGADPSEMNFGDLYPALKEGVMHAQENPLSVIWSKKLYEVQKYLTVWNYSYDPIILCMNRRRWEGLSPAERTILREAAVEAMAYERKLVEQSDKDLLRKLEQAGMEVHHLSAAERKRFQEKSKRIYEEYSSVIGRDLINDFVKATRE